MLFFMTLSAPKGLIVFRLHFETSSRKPIKAKEELKLFLYSYVNYDCTDLEVVLKSNLSVAYLAVF